LCLIGETPFPEGIGASQAVKPVIHAIISNVQRKNSCSMKFSKRTKRCLPLLQRGLRGCHHDRRRRGVTDEIPEGHLGSLAGVVMLLTAPTGSFPIPANPVSIHPLMVFSLKLPRDDIRSGPPSKPGASDRSPP
jgi:hypothetical protein